MKVSLSADTGQAGGVTSTRPVNALALGGLAVAAIGIAAIANPATIEDGPVICPFRLLTGLPCPGCGLTRSWVYLVHADWQDSLTANPFGPILFGLAVVFVVTCAVAVVRRRSLPDVSTLVRSRAATALGLVWVAFGLIRLLVEVRTR